MTGTAQDPIRRGRKFDQVLAGARTIFLRDGYERASVDDIAREGGVSKATLYSYFPDKSLMFIEVAKAECQRQTAEALAVIDDRTTVRGVLAMAGERMVDFLMSDFGQRVFRICVAEGQRFPDLAREFYRSGPMMIRDTLAHYLRCAGQRGEVRIDDYDLAAEQFMQLCKADVHERLIFGMADALTPEDRRRTIDGAVGMFMARYGV